MARGGGKAARAKGKKIDRKVDLGRWKEARSMDEGPAIQGIVNWRVIVSFEPDREDRRRVS